MAEFIGLPPEQRLAEELPAPAPEIYPPPREGAVGRNTGDGAERRQGRTAARRRSKIALLLAAAGFTLCGVLYSAPQKSSTTAEPSAEATQTETEPAQAGSEPTVSEPAVLSDAGRLVSIGTWKNSTESEWVHFNADGTGWWYDGTYFGRMVWEEGADGSVSYEAGMSYLGPGLRFGDDAHTPEKDGDCLHSVRESGGIDLLPDEDSFTCPGLRFGEGSYLPDNTPIDASVMDGVCGKTSAELLSGTSWHMAAISDLGIPVAPSSEGGKPELYTDTVYVERMDFSSGTIRFATRDDGLLWREDWTVTGDSIYDDAAETLDVSISLADGGGRADAAAAVAIEITFGYFSDLRPGDVAYNNLHFLWGRSIGTQPTDVYLLITSAGIRLGADCIDLYNDNYTLLASD